MTSVRRTGTASAAALSGLALALGLSHAVAPGWPRRFGLDVWNVAAAQAAYRAAGDEREALESGHERMFREIAAAEALAARVAAGTLPLAAAAAELEPILVRRVGFTSTCEVHYHVPTTRLGAARYLLLKVTDLTADDPGAQAATLTRLETEFAAMR